MEPPWKCLLVVANMVDLLSFFLSVGSMKSNHVLFDRGGMGLCCSSSSVSLRRTFVPSVIVLPRGLCLFLDLILGELKWLLCRRVLDFLSNFSERRGKSSATDMQTFSTHTLTICRRDGCIDHSGHVRMLKLWRICQRPKMNRRPVQCPNIRQHIFK